MLSCSCCDHAETSADAPTGCQHRVGDAPSRLSAERSNLRRVDSNLDYVAALTRESARFAEAIRGAAPDTPVPTCPGWTADDLLWHLGEVQWFWAAVVREMRPR